MIKLKFKSNKNGVPIISKEDIEYFAEIIIKDYDAKILKSPTKFNTEDFLEFYLELDIDYKDLTSDRSTIGMIVFSDGNVPIYDIKTNSDKKIWVNKGTIIIDNSLLQEEQLARGRFTICHELSHWILHRHIYKKNENQLSFFENKRKENNSLIKCRDVDVESTYKRNNTRNDSDWIEWQADYMAAALLMPRNTFTYVVKEKFEQIGIKNGHYRLGADLKKDLLLESLYREIAILFNVSITATKIRLKDLGLIITKSKNLQLYFN